MFVADRYGPGVEMCYRLRIDHPRKPHLRSEVDPLGDPAAASTPSECPCTDSQRELESLARRSYSRSPEGAKDCTVARQRERRTVLTQSYKSEPY